MNSVITAFLLTTLAGLSTGIGSCIAFVAKHTNKKFLSVSLGFSAGVMIYVSLVEILAKAKTSLTAELGERTGNWIVILAFFGGMLVIAVIDKLIPSEENPHEVRCVEDEDKKSGKLMRMGVFTALALIFSYVETLIPINFGIPGVKLGLANLVIVIALYKMKLTEVYLLSVVRVLLAGFIFGNYFSIIYSLAGGLLSLTVMALLKKSKGFSVMGISVAGGVFHNVGQLIVAMLVVETFSVGYYFSVLLVAGVITGLVIGIVSAEMLKRIKNIQF